MSQSSFDFDVTRNRHQGNPQSEAAHRRNKSRSFTQRITIFGVLRETWLRKTDGLTVEEISRVLDMRYTAVSARVSELKREGLVMPSGKTRPTETGSQAAVIIPVTKEKECQGPEKSENL